MTTTPNQELVRNALRSVDDPELHKDLVSLDMVRNIHVDGDSVQVEIELTTPACPLKSQIEEDVRKAVEQIEGVSTVQVEFSANVRSGPQPASKFLPGVKNVIAVGAGKGGVGKSTMALNLAVGLQQFGARVGLLDADVYGPSIPLMLGIEDLTPVANSEKRIVVPEAHGIQILSMGFFIEKDQPVIWRGPMLHGAIQQFLGQAIWGELDYLIIDLPPGTGDVALSLSQSISMAGGVVVTTPQEVSVIDVRKAIGMFRKLGIHVLGVIENMSGYVCTGCGHEEDIFGTGGGTEMAKTLDTSFLGKVPIDPSVRQGGDSGTPSLVSHPNSTSSVAIKKIVQTVAGQISQRSLLNAESPPVQINRR